MHCGFEIAVDYVEHGCEGSIEATDRIRKGYRVLLDTVRDERVRGLKEPRAPTREERDAVAIDLPHLGRRTEYACNRVDDGASHFFDVVSKLSQADGAGFRALVLAASDRHVASFFGSLMRPSWATD